MSTVAIDKCARFPLIAAALTGAPVPLFGTGAQRRDFTFVGDIVAANLAAAEHPHAHGAYNIGTGVEMTNLEMVEILLDELGKPASLIQFVEDRPGHDRRYSLDVGKIRALGWEPDHSCEEALRATARWYVDHPEWWQPIRAGEFQRYYDQVYGQRRVLG